MAGGDISDNDTDNFFASFAKSPSHQARAGGPPADLQEAANALYVRIYDAIDKSKNQANGKPLAILVGEQHKDKSALLVEMMAIDICIRLGITNVLFEADAATINEQKASLSGFDGLLPKNNAPIGLNPSDQKIISAAQGFRALTQHPQSGKNIQNIIDNTLENTSFLMFALRAHEMNLHAGDPNLSSRLVHQAKVIRGKTSFNAGHAAVENHAIAGAILPHAAKGALSIGGRFHLPDVADELVKNNVQVVALNTMAVTDEDKADTAVRPIYERLEKMDVFTLPDNLKISAIEALRVSVEASLNHRESMKDPGAAEAKRALQKAMGTVQRG